MDFKSISITEDKLTINFKFYLFLKEMNGTNGIKEKEINILLEIYYLHNKVAFKNIISLFSIEIDKIKSDDRKSNLYNLLLYINNKQDLSLFAFSLKLLQIKPFLLQEAKLVTSSNIIRKKNLHSLSVEYDRIGKNIAYYTRINGALISLLFFNHLEHKNHNFLSNVSNDYIKDLICDYQTAKSFSVEPNEIFMLMFSESINQSIISDAGSSYEDRIFNLLVSLGINRDKITKTHDKDDKSTEYDFFFQLDNKSYGIGAKRTLRERYKQFIKTSHTSKIDIMIEITLGLDLTIEKARSIRKHGVYIFVADEIFDTREYLRDIEGIFPASKLDIETLKNLAK